MVGNIPENDEEMAALAAETFEPLDVEHENVGVFQFDANTYNFMHCCVGACKKTQDDLEEVLESQPELPVYMLEIIQSTREVYEERLQLMHETERRIAISMVRVMQRGGGHGPVH